MRNLTMLGLTLAAVGCNQGPSAAETGAIKLEDVVQTTDDALRVWVERREVPLREMPIVASLLAGLPMTGLADIAIDLVVPNTNGSRDYKNASGSIAIACPSGCTIGDDATHIQVPGMPTGGLAFGHLTFDKVNIRAESKSGQVKITRWQLESKDLTLNATLNIDLATQLDDSALDGCLRFKASPLLARRDPKTAAIIATTGAALGADGFYSIKIAGRIGQRKFLAQAC